MKKSEERIIRYLMLVEQHDKYLRKISTKLGIDYCYLIGLIYSMVDKGWLRRVKYRGRTFCELTEQAPELPMVKE